jgi:integrase
MPRPPGKRTGADLTAMQVKRLKPGRHRASRDLYCLIRGGSRLWIHRHTGPDGRVRDMSLGSLDLITLAEAREKVLANRKLLHAGKDPLQRSSGQTFEAVAKLYYDAHQAEWGSDRYRTQWWSGMAQHIFPSLGKMPIDAITMGGVLKVIQPLWGKLQYAPVLRGRGEQVWDYAKAAKLVTGENPFAMRGNLGPLLGNVRQIMQTRHQPALPWAQMPGFMAELRATDGVEARALEFCILTAVRANAVNGARWPEIDLDAAVWVVPAERVKGRKASRKPFRVPLAARALAILYSLPRCGDYLFASAGRPLDEHAMLLVLRTFGRVDVHGEPVVVHGFRSAFQDWASETTHFPSMVIEMAMGHAIGKKVEASYRRGDLYSQRTSLMVDWSDYCGS